MIRGHSSANCVITNCHHWLAQLPGGRHVKPNIVAKEHTIRLENLFLFSVNSHNYQSLLTSEILRSNASDGLCSLPYLGTGTQSTLWQVLVECVEVMVGICDGCWFWWQLPQREEWRMCVGMYLRWSVWYLDVDLLWIPLPGKHLAIWLLLYT